MLSKVVNNSHSKTEQSAKDKLIVALDVETATEAKALVTALRDVAGMFKIGSQLFTAAGPDIVRDIVGSGNKVFLDLKFCDIPNTVAGAGVEATRLGVSIFNVHALGGGEMMRRTVGAVSEAVEREGLSRPFVIAVTILTSADASVLTEIGISATPSDQVRRLALLADASGMDGVVASPRETAEIRSVVKKDGFLIVTPGVRPRGSALDDQKRVATPGEAIKAGASHIVVGRPITAAKDPATVAGQIVAEMGLGLNAPA
ncbi:MAG: orotidine-5'-phosphate decarboxylase [Pyrinomonadaceae bacterium]